MTVVLASTWRPRGERERFERLFPDLSDAYGGLVVIFPPVANPAQVEVLMSSVLVDLPEVKLKFSPDWSWGRGYINLKIHQGMRILKKIVIEKYE